jgi:hypothetical protein
MPEHTYDDNIDDADDDWDEDRHDNAAGDDELDAVDAAECPECGAPVERIADRCPACGRWLTDGDRRAMWPSERKSAWLVATAWLLLAMVLFGLVGIAVRLIKSGNE